MYKLKTQIDFECAHRLYDVDTYSKECRDNIHGHSYKVTIFIGREHLNKAGMVIDFKLLKEILKKEITDIWDHSCVLKVTDPLAQVINDNCAKVVIGELDPTAESMAYSFFHTIKTALYDVDKKIKLLEVWVQETEHNIAIYSE